MRRRLFFWIDKLKIPRAERVVISALMVLLLLLVLIDALISPSSPFDKAYYHELDSAFQQRSAELKRQEEEVMARYEAGKPNAKAPVAPSVDTLEPNTRSGLIDINTADTAALQQLPGIGPAYATRIVAYRQRNGPFRRKQDLLNVHGIGPARFNQIEGLITVNALADTIDTRSMDADRDSVHIASASQVNVNTADAQALQQLPGIGPAYADRIIAYRREHGPFTDIEQLLAVRGIGKKRLAIIKPFIKLTDH